MIRQDIDIAGYWKLIIVYSAELWDYNTGFTYTDFNRKLSIVAIGKTDSLELLLNTIVHEAKHVQSHICNYYNVKEDGELAAYLIGYIILKMHRVFKKLIYNNKR